MRADDLARLLASGADGRPALHDPDALLAAARALAGGTPADGWRRDALTELCAAFAASPLRLSYLGTKVAERALVDALVAYQRLARTRAARPELRERRLEGTILVVAPHRSGTTFLQRLLAQDPAHRAPRVWEALPASGDPPPGASDPRIEAMRVALAHRARRAPELARMHAVDVDAAEECTGFLETSLLSASFLFHGPLPRYLAWLEARPPEDWRWAYGVYADQLRRLDADAPGRRWVLKSPVHLARLEAFLANVPDTLVVWLHREPVGCLASFCTLLRRTWASLAADPDPHRVGATALEFVRTSAARADAARRALAGARFVDLSFVSLLADPLAAVRTIYAARGVPLEPPAEARMRAWLVAQGDVRPKARALEPFGLDAEAARAAFAPFHAWAPEGFHP